MLFESANAFYQRRLAQAIFAAAAPMLPRLGDDEEMAQQRGMPRSRMTLGYRKMPLRDCSGYQEALDRSSVDGSRLPDL